MREKIEIIISELRKLEKELDKINAQLHEIALKTTQCKMKQGRIYLKLRTKNKQIYPVWAVSLFSSKNGKFFSKEIGTKLTKKTVKNTKNGRHMQQLLELDEELQPLLLRRKRLSRLLISIYMKLASARAKP